MRDNVDTTGSFRESVHAYRSQEHLETVPKTDFKTLRGILSSFGAWNLFVLFLLCFGYLMLFPWMMEYLGGGVFFFPLILAVWFGWYDGRLGGLFAGSCLFATHWLLFFLTSEYSDGLWLRASLECTLLLLFGIVGGSLKRLQLQFATQVKQQKQKRMIEFFSKLDSSTPQSPGFSGGYWGWNLMEGEIFFSKEWKKLLGYEDAELESKVEEWFQRVHPQDLKELIEDLESVVSGSSSSFINEHRLTHADKATHWFCCYAFSEKDSEGRLLRLQGYLSDIESRKMIEDKWFFHEGSSIASPSVLNISSEDTSSQRNSP